MRDEHIGVLIDGALEHVDALGQPGREEFDPFGDAQSAAS